MDWRAQLATAGVALAIAAAGALRKRIKSGKRVMPKMRARVQFSMQTHSDPPRRDGEREDDPDIQIVGELDARELDQGELETRRTDPPPKQRTRRIYDGR